MRPFVLVALPRSTTTSPPTRQSFDGSATQREEPLGLPGKMQRKKGTRLGRSVNSTKLGRTRRVASPFSPTMGNLPLCCPCKSQKSDRAVQSRPDHLYPRHQPALASWQGLATRESAVTEKSFFLTISSPCLGVFLAKEPGPVSFRRNLLVLCCRHIRANHRGRH